MDQRSMEYMAGIGEAGSIQAAAQRLGRDASTLGRALRAAEEELGIVIFRRTARGLVPTREGAVFLEGAGRMLELLRGLGAGSMTRREMEYLTAIREKGSICAAARALFVSQPSLSQAVKKLERAYGLRLFLREAEGLRETPEGKEFLDRVGEAQREFLKIRRELEEFQNMSRGLIRFGIPLNLGAAILPRILPEFTARYPGVEVEFKEQNSAGLDRLLLKGTIDFSIMHLEKEHPAIRYEYLGTDPFLLAARGELGRRLGFAEGASLGEEELRRLEGQPFVMVEKGQRLRETAEGILERQGVKARVCCCSKNMETAKRLAAEGMGFTLLPRSYLNLYSGGQGLSCWGLREELGASWHLVIGLRRGERPGACAGRFLGLLKERIPAEG